MTMPWLHGMGGCLALEEPIVISLCMMIATSTTIVTHTLERLTSYQMGYPLDLRKGRSI
jgi:hypothetical protein